MLLPDASRVNVAGTAVGRGAPAAGRGLGPWASVTGNTGAFGMVAGVSALAASSARAAGELWQAIDIRTAMLVTVVAMTLAGLILALYRGEAASRSSR